MGKSISERRMLENESVFREYNERVKKSFDKLRKTAKEDGQEHLVDIDEDTQLHFYCECSDENCTERVVMKPSKYNEIHKNRDKFVLINGHEVESIEKVTSKNPSYSVVEKFNSAPESPVNLNVTEVDNS